MKYQSKESPWLLMLSAMDFHKKKIEHKIFSDLEEWEMNIEQV